MLYRAEDLKLKREVALKFLPDVVTHDRSAIERFEREAEAAAAINHPNICTVHEIGEFEGSTYIAMELLQGETLKHRISNKPIALDTLLEWAIQITDGLDAVDRAPQAPQAPQATRATRAPSSSQQDLRFSRSLNPGYLQRFTVFAPS